MSTDQNDSGQAIDADDVEGHVFHKPQVAGIDDDEDDVEGHGLTQLKL